MEQNEKTYSFTLCLVDYKCVNTRPYEYEVLEILDLDSTLDLEFSEVEFNSDKLLLIHLVEYLKESMRLSYSVLHRSFKIDRSEDNILLSRKVGQDNYPPLYAFKLTNIKET